jgi:hypothetical protein
MLNHASWASFAAELPDHYDFPDFGATENVPTIIGPKATVETDVMNIPIATIRAVAAGTEHVYVWGWADYDDVFNDTPRHRTEFCYKLWILPQQQGVALSGFAFTGNTMAPMVSAIAVHLLTYRHSDGRDRARMARPYLHGPLPRSEPGRIRLGAFAT